MNSLSAVATGSGIGAPAVAPSVAGDDVGDIDADVVLVVPLGSSCVLQLAASAIAAAETVTSFR
jgi:hypothetical protein